MNERRTRFFFFFLQLTMIWVFCYFYSFFVCRFFPPSLKSTFSSEEEEAAAPPAPPSSAPTTVTRSSTTNPASLRLRAAAAPSEEAAGASEGRRQLSQPQSSDQTIASAPGLRQQASQAGSARAGDPRGNEGERGEGSGEVGEAGGEGGGEGARLVSPQSTAGALDTSAQLEAAMPRTLSPARRCAASRRVYATRTPGSTRMRAGAARRRRREEAEGKGEGSSRSPPRSSRSAPAASSSSPSAPRRSRSLHRREHSDAAHSPFPAARKRRGGKEGAGTEEEVGIMPSSPSSSAPPLFPLLLSLSSLSLRLHSLLPAPTSPPATKGPASIATSPFQQHFTGKGKPRETRGSE